MSCSDCANLLSIPVFSTYTSCADIPNVIVTYSSSSDCFSALEINTPIGLTVEELFTYLASNANSLTHLEKLSVTHAGLTGTFPDVLAEPQLSSLTAIDFSHNHIIGPLPSLTGSHVTTLIVNDNLFDGSVTDTYLSILKGEYDLSHNCLTGTLPALAPLQLIEYQGGMSGTKKNPDAQCSYAPAGYAGAGTSSSTTTTTSTAASTPTLSSLTACIVQQQIYANNLNNTNFYNNVVLPCPANNTYMQWGVQFVTATTSSTMSNTNTKTTTTKTTTTTTTKTTTTKTTTKASSSSSTSSKAFLKLRRRDRRHQRVLHRRASGATVSVVKSLSYAGLGLVGPIPALMGDLTTLTSLDFSGNSFSGTWPSSMSKLVNLRSVNAANSGITDPLPTAVLSVIQANGGSINWGTTCNYQNPNAVCSNPAIPAIDCYALSRDKSFVDPIYDAAWQSSFSWAYTGEKIGEKIGSKNYGVVPYYNAAFQDYISKLRYCQKNHKEYLYWTYDRVHPKKAVSPYQFPDAGMAKAMANYIAGPN